MSQVTYRLDPAENRPDSAQMVLVALGSNQESGVGTPEQTVARALEMITEKGHVIRDKSRFFKTPAFPKHSGPDFVNAAISVENTGAARSLLRDLHVIEVEMGRIRLNRWAQRVIDLDLLAWGDVVLPDPLTHESWRSMSLDDQMRNAPDELILPHPRMQDRAFVLVPLMDICPDWVHPLLGTSVAQMTAALAPEDRDSVIPLVNSPGRA